MINDTRGFAVDEDFGDIEIDGKVEIIKDIKAYIENYIKTFDIAPIGVSIIASNVPLGVEPSGRGTMYNLYTIKVL